MLGGNLNLERDELPKISLPFLRLENEGGGVHGLYLIIFVVSRRVNIELMLMGNKAKKAEVEVMIH